LGCIDASLNVECQIGRLDAASQGARVVELFQRTTQFTTTGRTFTESELERIASANDGDVFVMQVRDRFADHGLTAAAVIAGGEIVALAMSCRVIGLGVEHRFVWPAPAPHSAAKSSRPPAMRPSEISMPIMVSHATGMASGGSL